MTVVGLLFLLLVVYQLKHFIADYPLQANKYMLGKFLDGWDWVKPLMAHVAVHGAMTAVIANCVFLANGVDNIGLALEIGLFDAVVHFLMDRAKAGKKYMGRWKPLTAAEYIECTSYLKQPQEQRDLRERVIAAQARILGPASGPQIPAESQEVLARQRLRGNTFFWWALGFDQMVHHLTHYTCIYMMLVTIGVL